MTIQQLRYLMEVARIGSFSAAAQELYVAQSTLSSAVKELEAELGVIAFTRSNRGIALTEDGIELLGYAQQVLEQVDLLEHHYADERAEPGRRLSISTQHYAFSVRAFVNLVRGIDADRYDLTMRETRTSEIISDVREFRSDLGILFLSSYNERALRRKLAEADLEFTELFKAKSHVFIGAGHPLAHRATIALEELADYPRLSFEQGTDNAFYLFEEPFSSLAHGRNITFTDRGTLTNLLVAGAGYTLSTGVLSNEMQEGIVSIPLREVETMRVGYLTHRERRPSTLAKRYICELVSCINDSEQVTLA